MRQPQLMQDSNQDQEANKEKGKFKMIRLNLLISHLLDVACLRNLGRCLLKTSCKTYD